MQNELNQEELRKDMILFDFIRGKKAETHSTE